jgi:hypothetical protein
LEMRHAGRALLRCVGRLPPLGCVLIAFDRLGWLDHSAANWIVYGGLALALIVAALLPFLRRGAQMDPVPGWRRAFRSVHTLLGDLGLVALPVLAYLYAAPFADRAGLRLEPPPGWVSFDLHAHSDTSRDAWMGGAERLALFARHGVRLTGVSEHGYFHAPKRGGPDFLSMRAEAERLNLDLQVLPAQEFTTSELHLLIVGGHDSYARRTYRTPPSSPASAGRSFDFQRLIADVHRDGGYCVVAHWWMPFTWGRIDWRTLIDWGVDGFEITNGAELAPKQLVEAWRAAGLRLFATNDFHYVRKSLYSWNLIPEATINPRSLPWRELKPYAAVERIFSAPDRRLAVVDLAIDAPAWIQPPLLLLRYLRGLAMHQRISWAVWSLVVVSIVAACRRRARRRSVLVAKVPVIQAPERPADPVPGTTR